MEKNLPGNAGDIRDTEPGLKRAWNPSPYALSLPYSPLQKEIAMLLDSKGHLWIYMLNLLYIL